MNRGSSFATVARTKKSLVFFWIALFVMSMGMQYLAAATPASVLAANPSANLDQCANDPAPSPATNGCHNLPNGWENGNLGPSKSIYFEGDSIPYRLTFGDLDTTQSNSHDVIIEWDTTKSGKHALDYLTTWNRTVADADPCLGVPGCGAFSTDVAAIPADPQVTGAGVTPDPGVFTIFGGKITGVSGYSGDSGFPAGDNSRRITITFTADVPNPVLAWGGHIAARKDWGLLQSAVNISGSPYHMRLIDLDGSGGNQDRSLSAAAVIFPGSITIIKEATPEGSTSFPFTASPAPLGNFSLVDDGSNTDTKAFTGITNFQTYTVTEGSVNSWDLTGVVCAGGGSPAINGATVTIDLAEGQNVVCRYSNHRLDRTLSITKTDNTVSYDHVGQVIAFTITATNTGNVPQAITVNDTPALDGFSCTPANGSTIAPAGTITCTGTHTVTQADLNAGKFDDTACANATGATEACADDTVPAIQSPALSITKVANPTTYNAVGQTITYTIVATNTGNVTIASATITDANATLGTCTPANGSSLDPLASITCSATHAITQADIDAGSYLNTACVDDGPNGATEVCADANVTAVSNRLLTITKVVAETSYSSVGQVLNYTIVAINGGNTTLANVTITDANATLGICTPANGSTLAPGASINCTATHTVTQADIDAGSYLNTACVNATDATATCDDVDVPSDHNPNLTIEKRVTETTYSAVGDVLHYTMVATNDGNITLHNVVVTDPKVSGLVCGDGTNLAPGGSIICNATHTVTQADIDAGHYLNTACVTATGLDATCASASVASATLAVAKSNDAPLEELELPDGTTASLPTAKEGTTVTFTLTYSVGTSKLTNGVITDVLPVGLTYVEGSATNSAEFSFVPPFNATTRTLTWTAASVTTGGTVTYKATVDKGAAALDQPLTNVATIDSAETAPSSDTSDVFVPVPPLAETHVPTAPPTDTLEPTEVGQSGTSLPLILAILGVILLAVVFVTPVPAPVRRRNRR